MTLAYQSESAHQLAVAVGCRNRVGLDVGFDAHDVVGTLVADYLRCRKVNHLDVLGHHDMGGHLVVDKYEFLCRRFCGAYDGHGQRSGNDYVLHIESDLAVNMLRLN